jgi:hypothetical protein
MAERRNKPVPRGKAGPARKARHDGWTAARREIFLDHYAENGNAAEAARAAGLSERGVYSLCRRDPEFAAQHAHAFAISRLRLEEMAILFARTGGKAPGAAGETMPDFANFDFDRVLGILNRNRPSVGDARPSGPRPRAASEAELIETAMKLLGMLNKRRAKARLAKARLAKARRTGR